MRTRGEGVRPSGYNLGVPHPRTRTRHPAPSVEPTSRWYRAPQLLTMLSYIPLERRQAEITRAQSQSASLLEPSAVHPPFAPDQWQRCAGPADRRPSCWLCGCLGKLPSVGCWRPRSADRRAVRLIRRPVSPSNTPLLTHKALDACRRPPVAKNAPGVYKGHKGDRKPGRGGRPT